MDTAPTRTYKYGEQHSCENCHSGGLESASCRYDMLLAYQAKPAPAVQDFNTELTKLTKDPIMMGYIEDLRRFVLALMRYLCSIIAPNP